MSMSARERMLGRLRSAPASADAPTRAAVDAWVGTHYPARADLAGSAAKVDSMLRMMSAVRTDIWTARPDQWPAQLAAKLAGHGARNLLLDPALKESQALQASLPASIAPLAFARPLEAWKGELFDGVDAGFTVARSGIAATGTLILAPDGGTPRTVSLAPPLHVALVYASSLHADMYAAVKAEGWAKGMPSNLVMVSGPSKTSDIQQTLAYGAHGPRWMWVIVVLDHEEQGEAP
jgi:L-lactate dehydrogenase complex protein LldG